MASSPKRDEFMQAVRDNNASLLLEWLAAEDLSYWFYDGAFAAVKANALATLRVMLDRGLKPNIKTGQNYDPQVGADTGSQPLICDAADQGRLDVIRLLVERGESVNNSDGSGISPLCIAAQRGDLELMEWLLDHGADPNLVSLIGTPMHLAVRNEKPACVSSLLGRGVSPDQQSLSGVTARDEARRAKDPLIRTMLGV